MTSIYGVRKDWVRKDFWRRLAVHPALIIWFISHLWLVLLGRSQGVWSELRRESGASLRRWERFSTGRFGAIEFKLLFLGN